MATELSPHRRYYIKTQGGRFLVHNRHFLRRRVSASIPVNTQQTEVTHHDLAQDPPPRRSTHSKHPTRRLIEDTTWN